MKPVAGASMRTWLSPTSGGIRGCPQKYLGSAPILNLLDHVQTHLRHSQADDTANEYFQELPVRVKQILGSGYELLTKSEQPQAYARECATGVELA